jgi:hypothetical protein
MPLSTGLSTPFKLHATRMIFCYGRDVLPSDGRSASLSRAKEGELRFFQLGLPIPLPSGKRNWEPSGLHTTSPRKPRPDFGPSPRQKSSRNAASELGGGYSPHLTVWRLARDGGEMTSGVTTKARTEGSGA